MNIKNHASQYQTVKYTHKRPCAEFGDLTAPEGNAFIVNGRAANVLKNHGFTSESHEINFLAYYWKPNYDTVFDKLAFFLTLDTKPEEINLHDMAMQALKGDSEEIVFKISRKDYDKRQEEIYDWEESAATFNYWDKKTVESYLKKDELDIYDVEFSNTLGKNMLSYIYSLKDFKNIEQKLIDSGASIQQIEALLTHKDLSGSKSVNSMLWNIPKDSLDGLREAIELQIYLVSHYPNILDFTSEDVFGRNYVTQFFPIAEKLKGEVNDLERSKEEGKVLLTLAYFEYWHQTFKPLTGFSNAYEHNEEILKNKNTFWKTNGILEKMSDLRDKGAKYARVKIELEKTILEQLIKPAKDSSGSPKLKV